MALNVFRQLGYILHYKNTALKGMVILNKEWATDALYRVLDDDTVERNGGWFLKKDAEQIWYGNDVCWYRTRCRRHI